MFAKRFAIFALIVLFACTVLSVQALAGRGGKKVATAASGSFALVLVDSTDGVAHWGQHITFNVNSSATYTFVNVDCSQNGVLVYEQGKGFYVGWPLDQRNFILMSYAWTGGPADCTALMYSTDAYGGNFQSLATLAFPAYP